MFKKIMLVCAALTLLFQLNLANSASAAKKYGIVQESAGRSFVPVRFAAETFGFKVNWDSANNKVRISNKTDSVELIVDKTTAVVNGKSKTLDAAPFNLSGTVYVPLRFVGEALGVKVSYLKEGRIVIQSDTVKTEIEAVSLRRVEKALNEPVRTGSSKIATSTKTISVNTVYIDLYHPKVKFDAVYANNKIGSTETFKKMVERSKASVAVNGTFFNAYSETSTKIPYGYIVQNGKVINKASGDERSVFVYTKTGDALIADGESELKKLLDEGIVETALQAGPRLVSNGKVDTDPVGEGFKDPKILTSRGARSAIGITADGQLIIVTTAAASIPELAQVMVKLKAVEAMNLDGGASSGLYANGKYITPAGRDLSNALVMVFDK
ncbi:phosphodiester glycosidase family protein [Paenibacillus endoradicis]|uniref:phosphodiester glycosidase family protein n=1 Tax=Paenibacillus endoradicis TaxID=2972487 RepID=UPI0021599900|nr:phosphodiester glycosidase family protein [Paenibacillus endoradicis]MCR8658582.1 phosphodiester glycosidase family protein [Paenibacillus endoradicis]